MKKKRFLTIILLTISALLIAACGQTAEAEPTVDPIVLLTQVAGTVQAELTAAAPEPTIAPPPTATPLPVPTQPLPSLPTAPSGPPAANPAVPGQTPDDAKWIADLESPDGTIFEPGDRFTRVFQIENTGTTTWNTGYRLIYLDGQPIMCDEEDMNIYLQQSVEPTNQVTFSLSVTAPDPHGTYTNWFRMINDEGELFGEAFKIEIVVGTWEEKQAQYDD
jgi:hypothetical protein